MTVSLSFCNLESEDTNDSPILKGQFLELCLGSDTRALSLDICWVDVNAGTTYVPTAVLSIPVACSIELLLVGGDV